ncbi:MAG: RDD family protein [Elusimicrobia bacterium]|nr:RDD family protein [Elusimicrobiota bacterium]
MEDENLVFTPQASQMIEPVKPLPLQEEVLEGPLPAGFNERFLAYVIDAIPFVAVCYASFSLLIKKGLFVYSDSAQFKWKLLWILAYLVYETTLSSGGRATLGKYIMGIRVKDASGEDLGIFKAFLRSLAYFLSAFLLNLGFLLALFTRNKRALHDYIAGSRVVSLRERGDMANGMILALSWALIAIFCGAWINQSVLKMTPFEKRQVVAAYRTVYKLGVLEKIYLKENGHYTNDLKRLAALTGNLSAVRSELVRNLDEGSLVLASDGRGFSITAKARNWRKTEVQVTSPPSAF